MNTSSKLAGTVNVLVPVGSLGVGIQPEEMKRGVAAGAHVIAVDAGSTDSGPYPLATGISKHSREAIKHDLAIAMATQAEAGIPLLVGSCAMSGNDMAVAWTRDIVIEIAAEMGISPRVALLYSEQDPAVLKRKNAEGRIRPLAPSGPLEDKTIDACKHVVAVMGPEPYIAALEAGAEIILGGRTTDTAVLAALPILRGAPLGPAWHASKIAECGSLCTVNPTDGKGVLIRIGADSFTIEPLAESNCCDVHSISAHMLYENANPFRLTEPGGVLDVTQAVYEAIDRRTVRVTGSRWEPMPYTMKLEGAGADQYQTLMLVGIEDPEVLANLDLFHDRILAQLYERVRQTMGEAAGNFNISLRFYGWNAVSGRSLPKGTPFPREVGLLFVATAATQAIATQIAKSCNSHLFHFPIKRGIEVPSYAFPFSPAEVERGPVYKFLLNHVVEIDDPLELVRTEWVDFSANKGAR